MLKKPQLEYSEEESFEDLSDASKLASKIKKLKDSLKDCQKQNQQYLTGWQRTQADFINYRRRQEENLKNYYGQAQAEIIRSFLPFLDSMEHALKYNEIQPLFQQLIIILQSYGLKEIKALGEKFNPLMHEAIEQIKANKPSGTIMEVAQKGYMIEDKVLRPSKVKVSK